MLRLKLCLALVLSWSRSRFEIIAPQRCGLVCFRLKSSDEANEELRYAISRGGEWTV